MARHHMVKVLKAHVITDKRASSRKVAVINAESMVELTKSLNAYLEMHPTTGTIYNTGFDPQENRYYALVDDVFNKPTVDESFECPLNTDQLTLGQHDVYFKEYPDIKWCVDHIDGDYVYLGGYNIDDTIQFSSSDASYSTSYPGSIIAQKCTDYLNNVIPNVADYLEDVTVEGVTNKVFIPTYYQFSGIAGFGDCSGPVFDYPSASAANRKACCSTVTSWGMWLSTAYSPSFVWFVNYNGDFNIPYPLDIFGFRPEVKVRFKKSS